MGMKDCCFLPELTRDLDIVALIEKRLRPNYLVFDRRLQELDLLPTFTCPTPSIQYGNNDGFASLLTRVLESPTEVFSNLPPSEMEVLVAGHHISDLVDEVLEKKESFPAFCPADININVLCVRRQTRGHSTEVHK